MIYIYHISFEMLKDLNFPLLVYFFNKSLFLMSK